MAGNRQQVCNAIAAYFGGNEVTTSEGGSYFQGGPLASAGLGTAFPYPVKAPVAEQFFTAGAGAGFGWGVALTVRLGDGQYVTRKAMAGPTGGWRLRRYMVSCGLEFRSWQPHAEVSFAGLDDLVDGLFDLLYADRTLGTSTNDVDRYPPNGRLITQAGEMPDGVKVTPLEIESITERGKATGGLSFTFAADTFVMA